MPLHKKSKRRGNASLKAWVNFVKKVQREEKLSYRDAMMRAKARKDKGEKWMKGGQYDDESEIVNDSVEEETMTKPEGEEEMMEGEMVEEQMGGQQGPFLKGGRRRRTHKRRGSKKRRHTRRRMSGGSFKHRFESGFAKFMGSKTGT
jgi:hypothetical protein